MSNTPSDEELNSVLCHHWPAFPMQAVLVQMWLRDAMRSALAKWSTPQPVAPLSNDAKDAARYRWLRATTNFATNSQGERIDVRNQPEKWDAVIDAALAAGGK